MGKVDNSSNSHIFSHSAPIIVLFAKQPVPGQVKTRLTPPLTSEQACRLYQAALQESVVRLLATGLPLLLCYSGSRAWFSTTFPGLSLMAQSDGDLGQRLSDVLQQAFSLGSGPVVLAGSDCPDLPLSLIEELLEALQVTDVVTIPCRDGGYAMIGVRRWVPTLFSEIPWSTSAVLDATRRRCQEHGLSFYQTAGWEDLDELADLQRLVARAPNSSTARHILDELAPLLESTG